jgi:hypothetical protein
MGAAPKGAVRIVLDEATACIDVAALIDLKAEIARLEKEIARHKGDIAAIAKKLSNEQFVAKAPPEVIEEQHTRRSAASPASKLSDALVQLKAGWARLHCCVRRSGALALHERTVHDPLAVRVFHLVAHRELASHLGAQ